jgi:uncharacterized protein YjbI with pentapeptide repeats
VDLYYTNLHLDGAILEGADLSNADLRRAKLNGANLRDADLTDADIQFADLVEADLTGAKLNGANLRGADLTDAEGLTVEQLKSVGESDNGDKQLPGLHCLPAYLLEVDNATEIAGIYNATIDAVAVALHEQQQRLGEKPRD